MTGRGRARGIGWSVGMLPLLLACGACPLPPPENAIADGETMERRLSEPLAGLWDLRAEAKAEQVTERGPVKGTLYLFLRGPDRLRFDSMTPVETPIAVLVSDGETFALHDVGANRYYWGEAAPCNIARLLRIPLDAASVVRLLVGVPPSLPEAAATVDWDGEGYYVYRQELEGGLVLEARIAPLGDELDALSARLADGAGTVWEVTWDDHRPTGGARLPWHVRFTARGADGPVEVWYGEIDTGVELPDDAWTYPQPEGIPGEEVGCETVIEPVEWGVAE